jgi:hypothetical protein
MFMSAEAPTIVCRCQRMKRRGIRYDPGVLDQPAGGYQNQYNTRFNGRYQ